MNQRLFTLGYEGRTVSQYIALLERHRVKLVCDVRKDPVSRKRGFSKRKLCEALDEAGIGYVHMPSLGIESRFRKTIKDRPKLLALYKTKILPEHKDQLRRILELLKVHKRVALTCLELDPELCHRSCVAQALVKASKSKLPRQDL